MNKHLDNVCIMQKYNDSEKVLELREQFRESENYIRKAVNCHDELVEALKRALNCENKNGILSIPCIEQMKQALKKASE